MKLKESILGLACLLFTIGSNGQTEPKQKINKLEGHIAATHSEVFTSPLFQETKPQASTEKWKVSVENIHAPKPYSQEEKAIKEAKNLLKETAELGLGEDNRINKRAFDPKIGLNFEGNELANVTPPDNSIAVSEDGYIVSVDNYTIEYYKTDGTILLSGETHKDFFNNSALTGSIFDPRVVFDPIEKKFIYVILHGNTPSTSKVLVSFSKSSNPMDGWFTYTININDLMNNNGTWFDYPSIGVSTNELYITGNMFKPNGNGNQFNQSIIMQIQKSTGFSGSNMVYQTWKDVRDAENNKAFTLKPLSYGHGSSYGPGVYLVSNYSNGSASQGKIFLYDLTDDMSASDETLKSFKFNMSGGYELAGDANMKGTSQLLKTGNCRVQRGFYLNGMAHFVFTSEYSTGYAGLTYCRIDIENASMSAKKYGLTGYDYAFPAIASLSATKEDKTVAIAFLRSGTAIYPETRVMLYDNDMNASNSVLIKSGETFVSLVSGSERWGDYCGIARKYGSAEPEVWVSGCYGVNDKRTNGYNAWIAQVNQAFSVSTEELHSNKQVEVFPNPILDYYSIDVPLSKVSFTKVSLIDQNGKLVKVLYEDNLKPGNNVLKFNKGVLQSGMYFVEVEHHSTKSTHKMLIE